MYCWQYLWKQSPVETWTTLFCCSLITSAYLKACNEPLFCYSGRNGRNTSQLTAMRYVFCTRALKSARAVTPFSRENPLWRPTMTENKHVSKRGQRLLLWNGEEPNIQIFVSKFHLLRFLSCKPKWSFAFSATVIQPYICDLRIVL